MSPWLLAALLFLPTLGVGGTIVSMLVRRARGQRAGKAEPPGKNLPGSAMKNRRLGR